MKLSANILSFLGADPEMRTEDGWTALHCAACWANHEVDSLLLALGMSINSRSNGNLTPLHLAINSPEDPDRVKRTIKVLLDAPGDYPFNNLNINHFEP